MPRTLLLADDSVTIQRVIELTFADEDIKVVAVSDGAQAIESIEASPPDIVLADVGMPGRTGYEVARHIKQSPRLAHIPVILLTGAFEPVDQRKAAEVGCDSVLAKPFEPQLVIQRVNELLSRTKLVSLDAGLASTPTPAPEPLTPPLADRPAAAPPKSSASAAEVDSYFDRLDRAFADLSGTSVDTAKTVQPIPHLGQVTKPSDEIRPKASADPVDIDWFGTKPSVDRSPESAIDFQLAEEGVPASAAPFEPPPFDLPVALKPTIPEPDPPTPARAPVVSAPERVAAPVEPVATVHSPSAMPALADAFAALLTAEQRVAPPVWPAAASSDTGAPQPAPVDLDRITNEVVRRVLDQLSDRVVRETVADLVSNVAERLVREEIERIKASIK